jgi:HAD superfamily hydrolase (TIGR01549 family)
LVGVRVLEAVALDFGHTIVDFVLNERALYDTYDDIRALLVDFASGDLPTTSELVDRVSRELSRRIDQSYARQELEELDILAEFKACFAGINIDLPPELVREIAEREHRALTAELFLPPANAEALQALRSSGFRLGLVSNITLLGEFVRNDLHRLGLLDLFDAVVLSSELGVRKPHPHIYGSVLNALGVPGHATVFVGDRVREDVIGPRTAGMQAILTLEFRQEEYTPGADAPDAVIDRLVDLPAVARDLRARSTDSRDKDSST